ncbi:MAG: hypothetical protein I8N66_35655 [Ensifer sp. SSB1]|jgi:hypothetical protein|nr:hypothetical protein [Ensifer sp. SSB1]
MQKKIVGALVAGLVLSACGATPIVMRNPKTEQVVVCDGGARAREVGTGQMVADSCAQQLQAAGWVRADGAK